MMYKKVIIVGLAGFGLAVFMSGYPITAVVLLFSAAAVGTME